MLAELVRPRPGGSAASPAPPAPPLNDSAYASRKRLHDLRDALVASAGPPRRNSRWSEPPLFFFHPERQAELEAERPLSRKEPSPLQKRIEREVEHLCGSIELRHMARAVPGLREAAARQAVARDLAELLSIPDDTTILVLLPDLRRGFRLLVRGVATLHQFQTLLIDLVADELDRPRLPERFGIACRDVNPSIPAGVPMIVTLPFQCFRPAALQPDGALPGEFLGSDHWLWGREQLEVAPSVDGERTILLGEPAFPQSWEVERRFPAMSAETELLDVLSPFQVAERLSRLAGRPVPVHRGPERRKGLSAAA